MSIFEPRKTPKPFKYPEAIELMERLNHTFWLHSELPFNSDKQEIFKLKKHEQKAVLRSLLLISSIELQIKTFWSQLGDHFPSAEWSMLGIAAGESENRHFMSYSHIISLLNLENEFETVLEVPEVKGRYDYLQKYLKIGPNADKKKYITKLILFSVLMENTSLFSQFATLMFFYRKKGIMKDISNIIKWTAIDERLHFDIGSTIINIIRKEHPELIDEELITTIKKACIKSIKYEAAILDWVFEDGELNGLGKEDLLDFMKSQVNESLVKMKFEPIFEEGDLTNTEFFMEEVFADSMIDFFASRPTDYTLNDISITKEDLF